MKKQPLAVLRSLEYDVAKSSDSECCGFSVSLRDKEVSEGLLERAVSGFDDSKPLVTACPGCMMQLGRRHPNVRHIVELIEAGTKKSSRATSKAA